ncbi:M48 family metallopeptidase [Ilumatobacter sp.]|uniref:M48 family metallopeptidase n=1 Tax=Ilumatobacter sp. TaxID=1967498 RepID=UPI003C64CC52
MTDLVGSNKRRSLALVGAFVIGVTLLGFVLGLLLGSVAVVTGVAFVFAVLFVAGSYSGADSIALRVSRAQPADPEKYTRLHNLVDGLCVTVGVPKPAVLVVDDPAPNAFATGRGPNHASLVMTTGMLDSLERVELEGVVAHELSHIKNYDTLVSTLAVTLVGAIPLCADLLLRLKWWNGGRVERPADPAESGNPIAFGGYALLLFSPLFGWVMRTVIPVRRETLADLSACRLTRYPPGLIAALEKLDEDTTVTHSATTATAHLWIGQPLSGVGDAGRFGGIHKMFDTHPPLDERIALLREL